MKKNILFVISLSISYIMIGQNFVNTNPENKNVVLEEFTGIHCGFCPDGHVKAQAIYDQNPGDVVLINIHEGSFSSPSPGEPDFRTPFGAAIDAQAQVAGYPAGTVNRHLFPGLGQNGANIMAMSRSEWAGASSQILNETSYINIEAQATIDISTRELTVVVETYYTGTPIPTTANSVNVALLQNNVAGPQSGAASWNPSAIIPGNWNPTYNHQHMLRHLITGQWGETIPTTPAFWTNTYTYTIPSDLNGVAYDLFNLEVAVFVAEGQQEIITGNMATMNYIVPPGTNLVDMEASTNMTMPNSYCDNNVTPEITVVNNTNTAIDSFLVSYTLNMDPPVNQPVYTTLAAGASTTIQFSAITVPAGTNSISYSVGTISGSSFIDSMAANNISGSGNFNTLSSTAFGSPPYDEGFDSYSVGSAMINNGLIENPNNTNTYVVDNSVNSTVNWALGGFGNSANSYRFRFYSGWNAGDEVVLMWEKLDFSSDINNEISFSYAHALQNSWDNSELAIMVSTDCGISWTNAGVLSGSTLSTVSGAVTGTHFYPQTTEWATYTADLSAWDGESEVNVAIQAKYGGGNNLYIDDIWFDNGDADTWNCDPGVGCIIDGAGAGTYTSLAACQAACITTDINNKENTLMLLYPNPINNLLNINRTYSYLEIYDVFGKKVLESNPKKTIDVSSLNNGLYFVNIKTKEKTILRKITIKK